MKILVVHASAGAGHQKAAEALYDGLKSLPENHDVTLLDALDQASPQFKSLYKGAYFFLISKIPSIWGVTFALIDYPWIQPLIKKIRRIYNSINVKKFHKYLINEKFDYIFSTHFMPNEIVSALKRKELIRSKLICTVTDYDVHKIWLADGVSMYSVASHWTKEKMIKMGVPAAMIIDTGIPTHEKFSHPLNKGELRKKWGIGENIFTVLMATGSFGIGPIEEIIQAIDGECQVVVICGHNENLFTTLFNKKYNRVKVFGLVDNMHEMMEISDIMITKPGGLSISEALVKNLPLVFFNAIPGQETNNIAVLSRYGVGSEPFTIKQIVEKIKKFSESSGDMARAIESIQQLARPSAVKDIISLVK